MGPWTGRPFVCIGRVVLLSHPCVVAFANMAVATELTPNELCVLALLVERPAHGWGLADTLSRNGELGQIWAVARPLVYTTLRRLDTEGYIETAGIERGNRGPH